MTAHPAPILPEEELGSENSHTQGVIDTLDSCDLAEVRMILGDRSVKHVGVLRPGIMTPIQTCTKEQVAVYNEMLDADASWAAIDAKLIEMRPTAANGKPARSWLKMFNVDYLTVRSEDFRRPSDAKRLVDDYADQDGKVRTVPVWFTNNEIPLVIPHGYKGFVKSGIKYASFYGEDGSMQCRYLPDGKPFSRENYTIRPCPGKERPNPCPDYQAKRCSFGGLIRCNVPGVSGVGEIIVPTKSWNGLGESVANLKLVRKVFGRFQGLFHGQPFLRLSKVQERVPTADGKKQLQWIIVVEPSVPLEELATAREQEGPARARAAMAVFGPRTTSPVPPPRPADFLPADEDTPEADDHRTLPDKPQEPALEPGEIDPQTEAAISYLEQLAAHYKLPMDQVRTYASLEHGIAFLEASSVTALREFATALKEKAKADLDDLRAVLADLHRGMADGP